MKTIFVTLISLIFVSQAHAVRVKECPQTLKVEYSDLQLKPFTQIQSDFVKENYVELEEDELEMVEKSLAQLENRGAMSFQWKLHQAKGGRCDYTEYGGWSNDKIEIYTEKGVDKLRIQQTLDRITLTSWDIEKEVVLRIYARVASLEDGKIELSGTPSLALGLPRGSYMSYEAGGYLVFIGWLGELSIQ